MGDASRAAAIAIVMLSLASASLPAIAANAPLASRIMEQPAAPVRVVGCSADSVPMRNGRNVREASSFQITGAKTATAVRIGFAYFDVLGGRKVSSGVTTGKFSPGVRIDVPPYAGSIGAETHDVVCFAIEAAFDDGTTWQLPPAGYPRNADGEAAGGALVPTEIVARPESPVRLDRCTMYGLHADRITTDLSLTNAGSKIVRRVDVDFGFVDSGGMATPHVEWMRGDFATGMQITGSVRIPAGDRPLAKITCTVARVEFADGTAWGRAARAETTTGGGT